MPRVPAASRRRRTARGRLDTPARRRQHVRHQRGRVQQSCAATWAGAIAHRIRQPAPGRDGEGDVDGAAHRQYGGTERRCVGAEDGGMLQEHMAETYEEAAALRHGAASRARRASLNQARSDGGSLHATSNATVGQSVTARPCRRAAACNGTTTASGVDCGRRAPRTRAHRHHAHAQRLRRRRSGQRSCR
jgi:hypothetical protein